MEQRKWVVLVTVPFAGHRNVLDRVSLALRKHGYNTSLAIMSWSQNKENKDNKELQSTVMEQKVDGEVWFHSSNEIGTASPTEFTWSRVAELTKPLQDWIRLAAVSANHDQFPSLIIYDFFALEGFFVAKKLRLPCICSVPAIPGPDLINEPLFADALINNNDHIKYLKAHFTADFRIRTMSDGYFLDGAHETWFWAPLSLIDLESINDIQSHIVLPTSTQNQKNKNRQLTLSLDGSKMIYFCLGTVVLGNLWEQNVAVREFVVELVRSVIRYANVRSNTMVRFVFPGPHYHLLKHEVERYLKALPKNTSTRIICLHQVDQPAFFRDVKPDVFITHGGGNSAKEAIVYNIPMLVVPFFGDQHQCAKQIERHGLGLALHCDDKGEDISTKRTSFNRSSLLLLQSSLDQLLYDNISGTVHHSEDAEDDDEKEDSDEEKYCSYDDGVDQKSPKEKDCKYDEKSATDDVEEEEKEFVQMVVGRCEELSDSVVYMGGEGDLLFGTLADRKLFARALGATELFQVGNLLPFSKHPRYELSKLPYLIDQYNDVALDYTAFLQEWNEVNRGNSDYGHALSKYRSYLCQQLKLPFNFTKPISQVKRIQSVAPDEISAEDEWIWQVCKCALEYFVGQRGAKVHFVLGPNFVFGRNKITTWELKWLVNNIPASQLCLYRMDEAGTIVRVSSIVKPKELGVIQYVKDVHRLYQNQWWGLRSKLKAVHDFINLTIPCEFQCRLKSVDSATEKLISLEPGKVIDDWIGFRFIHPFTKNLHKISRILHETLLCEAMWYTERNRVIYMKNRTTPKQNIICSKPFTGGRIYEIQLWPTILYTCFAYEHDRIYKPPSSNGPLTQQQIQRAEHVRKQEHIIQDAVDHHSPPIPYPPL